MGDYGWFATTGDRTNLYSAADWRWSFTPAPISTEPLISQARKQAIARRRARLIAERNRWQGRDDR